MVEEEMSNYAFNCLASKSSVDAPDTIACIHRAARKYVTDIWKHVENIQFDEMDVVYSAMVSRRSVCPDYVLRVHALLEDRFKTPRYQKIFQQLPDKFKHFIVYWMFRIHELV